MMSSLKTIFHNTQEKSKYVPRALRLVFAAAPRWTAAWAFVLVLQGILPAISIYLTRPTINSLTAAFLADGELVLVREALFYIVIMVFITVVTNVTASLSGWITTTQSELVQNFIIYRIHEKAGELDLSFYEQSGYFDNLQQAIADASSQPLTLLHNIGNFIRYSITLVATIGMIWSFGFWLLPLLVLSALPLFFVKIRYGRRLNAWRLKTTFDRRKMGYFRNMITGSWSAAETRIYSLFPVFDKSYKDITTRLQQERSHLLGKQAGAEIAASFVAMLGAGIALAWMGWQTIQGIYTLGDITLFFRAINQTQSGANALLSSLSQMYRSLLFLENLFDYFDIEPRIVTPEQPVTISSPLKQGVHFQDITFTYPETDQPALNNFSLKLPAGKITAIVGENGAGKSTLIKLLARLYDPQEGQVKFDEVDIRDLDLALLRRRITVLMQFPLQFAATAGENIAMGNTHAQPSMARIKEAAEAAGADAPINRLPEGYDTLLTKWLGGAELSGGEWQRLGLARAFIRNADIVLLDEPTSFMDSWAEAEWLGKFKEFTKANTVVFVTHRFTTAMQADLIYVMKGGNVVESGSHDQLLASNGLYAQSWHAQMKKRI